MTNDYDIATDTAIERADLRAFKAEQGNVWEIARPLYDPRYDAYWLVARRPGYYHYTGPIALSAAILDLLPELTPTERRTAARHVPSEEGGIDGFYPHGIEVSVVTETDDAA